MIVKTPSCAFVIPEFLLDYKHPLDMEETIYEAYEDEARAALEWINRQAELNLINRERL